MDLDDLPVLAEIDGVAWLRTRQPVPYAEAVAAMDARVERILAGCAPETMWLLEHPPVYTGGASARPEEVLHPGTVPVIATGRGGRYTFHGPGQRVAYLLLDLGRRGRDLRRFVAAIEDWVIAALAEFGVAAGRRDGRIGVWVVTADGSDAKIGAVGLRLRRWVSHHGVAINVCPDLKYFDGIVPCGLAGYAVTSLHALGVTATLDALDQHLLRSFRDNFIAKFPSALDGRLSLREESRHAKPSAKSGI